jgi:E3 ubiquitin-protein ligase makorin
MMAKEKCIFFNSSSGCARGSNCKFSHSREEQSVCRYFKLGSCKRGSSCFYKHDIQNSPSEGSSRADVQAINPKSGEEIVCAVCFEDPQQFGLLIGCDHVFCLKCVREWRNATSKDMSLRESNVIKECPVCRTRSDFVVPSFKYKKGKEKEKEIESYKTKLGKISCKYFNRKGRYYRVCPFGDNCFYAHVDQNGKKLSCIKQISGTNSRGLARLNNFYLGFMGLQDEEDDEDEEDEEEWEDEDEDEGYYYSASDGLQALYEEQYFYFSDSDDDFDRYQYMY